MGAVKYRAVVGLSYPTDAKVIARLKRGEAVPGHEQKHVKPGSVVDDLPKESIPWLLAEGKIEKVGA